MSHLIFSRNAYHTELVSDTIQRLAPAVYANTVKNTLSDRYAQLRTADVLPIMADHGFVPTQAAQKRSRKADPLHTQHMVAFAHRDTLPGSAGYDGTRGEIIIYNSHDGTGSIKMFAGAFRFICSNGIVAGDGYQSRLYHNQANVNSFELMLTNTVKRMPVMLERIELMRNTQVSYDMSLELATKAALTRWDWTPELDVAAVPKGSYATGLTARSMLDVRRSDDRHTDAWTIFNRIQENVIRGGAMIKSFSERNAEGVYRKSRAVNSVNENIRVNRQLWDIAENTLELV